MAFSTIRNSRRIAGLLAASCLAAPVLAQQPGAAAVETAAADDLAPAEIVVTAQRREQRLVDVPISVSAFTGKDIENRGVATLSELQAAIPSLRIVDIGPGSQRIQLRGISQYLGLPTVGNYLDEFSVNNEGAAGSAEIRLLDLERVEVLRGPQPALYGEGSMGGTIRYVTAQPELDAVFGSVRGELSSVSDGDVGFRTEGVVNLPVATDSAAIRIAAAHEQLPGFADASFGKDINDGTVTTIRGKALVKPQGGPLTVSLLGLWHRADQDAKSYSLANRTTGQVVPSPTRQRYGLGNLVVSYDFGGATLLSSTGYLDQTGRTVDDSSRFYNQLFGAPLLRTALTDSRGTFKRFAQELRLASNGSGPLSYLLGGSYSNARTTGNVAGTGEGLTPVPPSALGVVFTQTSASRSKVLALFGSVNYDVASNLTIGLGGRYFRDRRSTNSVFALTGFGTPPSVSRGAATFTSFNPRVDITLKTSEDGILYANAAKGFRSGGFNQVIDPTTPPTFGPERLWSYEVGTKQGLLDNRLLLEAAIYYNDYKGIQATVIQSGVTVAGTRNAGKANGWGADFTLQARPQTDLSFSATLGWNDVAYKTLSPDRRPGDALDMVPRWTWSLAADYTPQISDGAKLILHADAGYTRKASITLRNLPPSLAPVNFTDSRVLVNARAGVAFGALEVYAFANNLFDEAKIVNPAFAAFFEPIRTRPRTVGLGFKGQF
ncbi:MAG: TonB-dependent receptor [Alphaproteobacteria bacterium]|nr:TonB-dependent receptor [Alphaproteobacteria bacterium]